MEKDIPIDDSLIKIKENKITKFLSKPFQCTITPNKQLDKVQFNRCWIKRVQVGIFLVLLAIFSIISIGLIIVYFVPSISYEIGGNLILLFIPIGILLLATLIGTLISTFKENLAILGLVINIISIISIFISIFLIFQNV